MRKSSALPAFGIFLLLCACQTTPKTVFTPLQSQSGKLLWKTSDSSIVSDAIIQRGQKDDMRLILSKEGGTPLLIVTRTGSMLEIDDRFKGRRWRGEATRMPIALAGWASLMEALIAIPHLPEGENEIHEAAGWNALYRKQNGRLQFLQLISTLSSDRYRLVLDSPDNGR